MRDPDDSGQGSNSSGDLPGGAIGSNTAVFIAIEGMIVGIIGKGIVMRAHS